MPIGASSKARRKRSSAAVSASSARRCSVMSIPTAIRCVNAPASSRSTWFDQRISRRSPLRAIRWFSWVTICPACAVSMFARMRARSSGGTRKSYGRPSASASPHPLNSSDWRLKRTMRQSASVTMIGAPATASVASLKSRSRRSSSCARRCSVTSWQVPTKRPRLAGSGSAVMCTVRSRPVSVMIRQSSSICISR